MEVMDLAQQTDRLPHKLTLNRREQLTVTGVDEVIGFDETAVILRTELGALHIHGQQLQLKELSVDSGQMAVTGQISALVYEEPRSRGGWFGRRKD
jgi:sporulation protein YabP